jgi:DNA (cytosine-5)-methyltransferase 1
LPDETGLKPLRTIRDAIESIPMGWPNHDPHSCALMDKLPFSPDTQAPTVTTGGGNNYHPSGKRNYTNREFAALQTFPLHHMFGDNLTASVIRKQIGNAVPPLFAKILFEHIKAELEKSDNA